MRTRLALLVAGLLVAGALVAGCGGEETTDTTGATPPTTNTGDGGSQRDSGGGSGGGASDPQIQQAVDACKQQIGAQPGISEGVRNDLEEICQKAASGDEEDVRQATREVCVKLIEENVPEGPARDQALSSCEQATTAP